MFYLSDEEFGGPQVKQMLVAASLDFQQEVAGPSSSQYLQSLAEIITHTW